MALTLTAALCSTWECARSPLLAHRRSEAVIHSGAIKDHVKQEPLVTQQGQPEIVAAIREIIVAPQRGPCAMVQGHGKERDARQKNSYSSLKAHSHFLSPVGILSSLTPQR
jgi:hypothetical protein